MAKQKGSFTLPGEAGYDKLTLEMAEKWGADVIRDSDGTVLSDEILNSDYGIYSTICIIRDHNEWIKRNMDKQQQTFLISKPVMAETKKIEISLLNGYFTEQFAINETEDSLKYWQVYDRTEEIEIDRQAWKYDKTSNAIYINNAKPWHRYTVSFLAYRIWEEISMYNHVTNNWQKEHLMQLDPIYEETQEYLLDWMENWCETHPSTTVVRFTSLFYNFVWLWGDNPRNRNLYTDWASYDFTVSPKALDEFEKQYGYGLCAEDFINKGKLHATHMVGDQKKLDWMDFIHDFVVGFGKKLVQIVHKYGKKAYIFYDDSWVGAEPYGKKFRELEMDGIIKCVFSGFEVRLCSGVQGVETHELRLHPYLFPTGLGGEPTFAEGGNPTLEAMRLWNNVRRALVRVPIDRIGLGGYLHLVQPFPDFCDYIEKISDEFRTYKILHQEGKPYVYPQKIAVLTSWGSLRSWICSGHLHEHPELDLINILESLSGMPFDIEFLSFEDICKDGISSDIKVIINAGFAESAWSGGEKWSNTRVIELLTEFSNRGGAFIGVNEPSAWEGYDYYFRMAHVLGIDLDKGERICNGRFTYELEKDRSVTQDGGSIKGKKGLYLTDEDTKVLMEDENGPCLTTHEFGKGLGIYLSSYRHNIENTRMLYHILMDAMKISKEKQVYLTDNIYTECSYFPESNKLIIINNSDKKQDTIVTLGDKKISLSLDAFDTRILDSNTI